MKKLKVRTRIAPSPTGIPHIGTARTTLFDYLLAKKYHGQFILRLEDTDQKRFVKGSIEAMHEINNFLGHIPDEGPKTGGPHAPYTQTKRLDLYQKYAQELVKKGAAYEDDGAIRIKMPKEGYTTWKDLVQGKISIPNEEIDDKVLLKSDGIPTYHLAVVVDDHLMEITHVIRGTEWISSTPVHLLLYQALNWQPPLFMHVPLILGPDKAKLGKRHGAKNVLQYRDEGYLPEAINNFLFYLGFSYKDNSDLLTMEEMIKIFDETKIRRQNAIFDIKKLDYFNSHWIRKLDDKDLLKRLAPFIPSDWQASQEKLATIIPLVKERLVALKDIQKFANFFFVFSPTNKKQLTEQSSVTAEKTKDYLKKVKKTIKDVSNWKTESIDKALHSLQGKVGWQPRQAFMTIRVAITSQEVTPPLFETIEIISQEETIKRLEKAIKTLS